MSPWNGVYDSDGSKEWKRRYLDRLFSLVGSFEDADDFAEAAWREEGNNISPEEAAEFEAQEWAAVSETEKDL